jgi:hypothetical protein
VTRILRLAPVLSPQRDQFAAAVLHLFAQFAQVCRIDDAVPYRHGAG